MKRYTCCMILLAALVSGCAQTRLQTRSERPVTTDVVARKPATSEPNLDQRERSEEPALIVHADGRKSSSSSRWQPTSAQEAAAPKPLPPAPAAQIEGSANGLSTLDSLELLAMSSNPTLTQLQAGVDAANGRWLQVGLYPNPEIAYTAPEIGNEGTLGQQGAYVQQEFVTADKLDLNRNAASWEVKRVEQELAAQRLRVLTDVRAGFYSLRVAQERVKIADELYRIAQQAVEKAKELVKVQEPETVLTQAEIEAELALVLLENSRVQQTAHWKSLMSVVGQPYLPQQDVTGELDVAAPQLVWEETLDRIRRESPELAAAAAEVEQTRWAVQRASVQAVPNVTVQAGSMYDFGTRDPIATLQIQLPVPIFNRNQGDIAEAYANSIAAERAVERMELSLQLRLAAVYQQYEQARQQASRYDGTILKKAKRNLDLNRQSYEAGESAYLGVLTAQRSYFQAKLAWLNALEQLWSATVQIEGLLLSDSLK
ncbi:MAG: TolC family protein [Planctomycetota bacterium]|nr:TolC family protein [Planctomycetota bacterium]